MRGLAGKASPAMARPGVPSGDLQSVLPSVKWWVPDWDFEEDLRRMERPRSEVLLDDLNQLLLGLKAAAGLSYADMARAARKSGVQISARTLSRAGEPGRWMTKETAATFAAICGGSDAEVEARKRWTEAHTERATEGTPRMRRARSIRTRGQLAAAMRRMLAYAGAPTLRELEVRGGRDHRGRLRLPRSSVSLALRTRGTRLPSVSLLEAFLRACSVPEYEARLWMAARQRVIAGGATARQVRHPGHSIRTARTGSGPHSSCNPQS